MREERREVLVVGAGPVGLFTALELAEAGVEVRIIDSQNRTAARSYACALHPGSLEALDRFGVAESLVASGRKVRRLSFYHGSSKEAEIEFSKLDSKFPFLIIVPQDEMERALEQRLAKSGVRVDWKHRFDNLSHEAESVSVAVQELSGTTTGYIVPHWETVVRRQIPMRVQFLVGADGHNSLTRQRLNINFPKYSGPDSFAAYEFESDQPGDDEVRVVMDEKTTNVLWPLAENKWRWTFQIVHAEEPGEFPEKERRAVHVTNRVVDERVRDYVQSVAARRAPWFEAKVREVTWCTRVTFEERLVERFGSERCWLAGDAAHQTGPVGVQSMNAGFFEGSTLAKALREIIHGEGGMELLGQYDEGCKALWAPLMGGGNLEAAGGYALSHRPERLIPCIPGLGKHFFALAAQIGLRPA